MLISFHSPPVDILVGLATDICVSVTEFVFDVRRSLKEEEDLRNRISFHIRSCYV